VGRLIDAADSVLCVIDVQDGFVEKLPTAERAPLLSRIAWLVTVAEWKGVPVVVTVEEPGHNGPVRGEVAGRLPPGTQAHVKPVFGLAADPAILAAVEARGRQTAVLIGLETDVCICHSALGLLDAGHRVVVVADAVASPGDAHAAGIERMRAAGAVLVQAKGLFYEWVRTVEEASRFDAERPDAGAPAGVTM